MHKIRGPMTLDLQFLKIEYVKWLYVFDINDYLSKPLKSSILGTGAVSKHLDSFDTSCFKHSSKSVPLFTVKLIENEKFRHRLIEILSLDTDCLSVDVVALNLTGDRPYG